MLKSLQNLLQYDATATIKGNFLIYKNKKYSSFEALSLFKDITSGQIEMEIEEIAPTPETHDVKSQENVNRKRARYQSEDNQIF